MKIGIGSRSIPKVIAITSAFSKYPELWLEDEEKIEYITIPKNIRNDNSKGNKKDEFSGVSCSPLTLEETIKGAKNRAQNAYEYVIEKEKKCAYGVRNRVRHVWGIRGR